MTTVQSHFQGRGDSQTLNSSVFDHDLDSSWTQTTDRTFRVRFEIEETAGAATPLAGTLEASYGGGSFFPVTATSGTVVASSSAHFLDADQTTDVLSGSGRTFTVGSGSEAGTFTAVSVNDSHTELEFGVRLLAAGVASGGTVALRVGGLDTYAQYPSLIVSDFSTRDRVRLKIGDTDASTVKLSDAEIDQYVSEWPDNVDLAAANAAEGIAASYADGFDFAEDSQTFNRSQRVEHYMTLAEQLRRRGGVLESS